MNQIKLFKAQPTVRTQPIESVTIVIDIPVPEADDLNKQGNLFEDEALKLGETLMKTLPGGTLDRLLVVLMRDKLSMFVVPLKE